MQGGGDGRRSGYAEGCDEAGAGIAGGHAAREGDEGDEGGLGFLDFREGGKSGGHGFVDCWPSGFLLDNGDEGLRGAGGKRASLEDAVFEDQLALQEREHGVAGDFGVVGLHGGNKRGADAVGRPVSGDVKGKAGGREELANEGVIEGGGGGGIVGDDHINGREGEVPEVVAEGELVGAGRDRSEGHGHFSGGAGGDGVGPCGAHEEIGTVGDSDGVGLFAGGLQERLEDG